LTRKGMPVTVRTAAVVDSGEMKPDRSAATCLFLVLACLSSPNAAVQRLKEPLPLDVVTSVRAHNGRSPVNLSPDGEWVAHTYGLAETVARDTRWFAATGFPFAEGDARMQAVLTSTRTGEVVHLGGDKGSSWGPVWSPDGTRVAFYADDSGETSLWIWERATRRSERFPGIIVRPFFGFEVVRWSADSERILCKVLPVGMTAAQANSIAPDGEASNRFPAVTAGQASVLVLRANIDKQTSAGQIQSGKVSGTERLRADLAILDVRTRRVIARVERLRACWYAFAPDQNHVAYTDVSGAEANSQQTLFDLVVLDLTTGARRTIVSAFRSAYGIDLNWSPDSRRIAYVASGQTGKGEMHIVASLGQDLQSVTSDAASSFDISDGERPPLWSPKGDRLYAVGADGKLWMVEAAGGHASVAVELAGHEFSRLVNRAGGATVWSADAGRTLWAIGRSRDGGNAAVYEIDLQSRTARVAWQEPKSYSTSFSVDANEATGNILFAARDQRHPFDLWRFSIGRRAVMQVTRLNEDLDRYELGITRRIEWTVDGQKRGGALLLPPGSREEQRLPLVVWVYGGDNGSEYVNTFGLTGAGATFNMQVLATRGYAVLYPDLPVREGQAASDVTSGVMAAVDAAVQQGYADPGRLAIMGQSYGALNVLSVLVRTNRFKAAVITACVIHPDLTAAFTEMTPTGEMAWTGYFEHGQGGMGGTPWQYPDRYRENSPLLQFDRIETPLLIGQGEKDGGLAASDAVFVALKRLGKSVEYRIYQNEGHVMTRTANVVDFWNRRLEFLDRYLNVSR
jgi:dipeptidyl aminopeptidase/acylaminoacyl peptidase